MLLTPAPAYVRACMHVCRCCIPGVVISSPHLQDMCEYLNSTFCQESYGLDLAMDDFVRSKEEREGTVSRLVVPNMVKHIGFVSCLHRMVWKTDREISFAIH